MSFGGSTRALPAPAQKPLGIHTDRSSTNEQARPIPYLAGRRRVGVTWIEAPFSIESVAVGSGGGGKGGKGGGGGGGTYDHYASLAGLVCHGPVSKLFAIWLNNDKVWEGPLTADGDFDDVTVEGYGVIRFYWGTENQDADAALLSGSGHAHPPYRRQCYVRLDHFYLGQGQTNAPNLEVEIAAYPAFSWHTAAVNVGDDCNPVAILAQWLTNPVYGLGWPESRLDTTRLNAAAQILAMEGVGLSPYLTGQEGAASVITKLLEYFDGYACWTDAGRFAIGLVRQPDDPGALPLITASDLTDVPEFEPESWLETRSKTWLKFTDRARDYQTVALPYREAGLANLTGDNTQQTLERPWVTRAALAQRLLAAAGRAAALPAISGRLAVLKSAANGVLSVGTPFRFQYDEYGPAEMILRVTKLTIPSPQAQSWDVEVKLDRAWLNDEFHVPADDDVPAPPTVDVEPITEQELFELPYGLALGANNDDVTLAPLAARPNKTATGFLMHFARALLLTEVANNWQSPTPVAGVSGTLGATYPAATHLHDQSLGILVTGLSSAEQAALQPVFAANKLILSLSSNAEIVAVTRMEAVSETSVRFFGLRAFRGGIFTHASGSPVVFYQNGKPLFSGSYTPVGRGDWFARRGTLEIQQSNTHPLLLDPPLATGLCNIIQFTGPDDDLGTVTLDDALDHRLLLITADEIMSIADVELVDPLPPKAWAVRCVRACYGTRRRAWTQGQSIPCWVIERERLTRFHDAGLQHLLQPHMKLQPQFYGRTLELGLVTPVFTIVTNRAKRPPPPANLACFGDFRAPCYTTGQSLSLTWDVCSERRRRLYDLFNRRRDEAGNPADQIHPVLPYTVLEFYTTGGVLKRTVQTANGAQTYTYASATLAADFGGQPDIVVRAHHAYSENLRSPYYETITVRKV